VGWLRGNHILPMRSQAQNKYPTAKSPLKKPYHARMRGFMELIMAGDFSVIRT
jgi:hypothetical protein